MARKTSLVRRRNEKSPQLGTPWPFNKDSDELPDEARMLTVRRGHLFYCGRRGWGECQLCKGSFSHASDPSDDLPSPGPPCDAPRLDQSPSMTSSDITSGDMLEFFSRLEVRQVRAAALILKCAFLELEDRHYSEVKFVDMVNPHSFRPP